MTPIDSLAAACAELSIADLVKPGVYILLLDGAIVYIGESGNVLARIGGHAKSIAFDRILWIAEADKRERRAIESALARRFAPPNCDVYSRRDEDRDAEILARFGLEPDTENARIISERTAACWPEESKRRAALERKDQIARRKAEQKRFARRGIAWSKCFFTRRRRECSRHLWLAVKSILDSKTGGVTS